MGSTDEVVIQVVSDPLPFGIVSRTFGPREEELTIDGDDTAPRIKGGDLADTVGDPVEDE